MNIYLKIYQLESYRIIFRNRGIKTNSLEAKILFWCMDIFIFFEPILSSAPAVEFRMRREIKNLAVNLGTKNVDIEYCAALSTRNKIENGCSSTCRFTRFPQKTCIS